MSVDRPRTTVPTLRRLKTSHERIAMVTAYDHPLASLLDRAGVDVILVGDTLGEVVQGHADTLAVTLDQAIYHAGLVTRACRSALVVGDLPFGSYQSGAATALASAIRLVKEAGVAAVKLEGGAPMTGVLRAIADADIPVMGHVGLTPQSVHRMGGYRIQGRDAGTAPGGRQRILDDARAVEEAGAFAVVLEAIPMDLAAEITDALAIPTIGIGAGPYCDGQVLVLHDLIGLSARRPRFARRYAEVAELVSGAAAAFVRDVKSGAFPSESESYGNRASDATPGPPLRAL
jgi:3-methyl-2-oxobutanoate hydroxymethyltransferase